MAMLRPRRGQAMRCDEMEGLFARQHGMRLRTRSAHEADGHRTDPQRHSRREKRETG